MKYSRTLVTLAAALILAGVPCLAQVAASTPGENSSNVGNLFFAQTYNYQSNPGLYIVAPASFAAGVVTITVSQGSIVLADGREVTAPFNCSPTCAPITINDGNPETVTPTASTGCYMKSTQVQPAATCQLTATFSNAHGFGAMISSGDSGFQEAYNDAAANGGGLVSWTIDCGTITLNTGGVTTTTTCLVPKTFVNGGGSVNVKTTITTTATYSLGIASATTAFITSCSSLTAALTCGQFETAPLSVAQGTGTGALLVTANAGSGAGAIHARVWGLTEAQSSF
jgi:hypothetical protein